MSQFVNIFLSSVSSPCLLDCLWFDNDPEIVEISPRLAVFKKTYILSLQDGIFIPSIFFLIFLRH